MTCNYYEHHIDKTKIQIGPTKDFVHVNQVTLDNSQHVENVMRKEVENQPHLNQPETEQTELIWE